MHFEGTQWSVLLISHIVLVLLRVSCTAFARTKFVIGINDSKILHAMPVEDFLRCMKLLNTLTFLVMSYAPEQSILKSALPIQSVGMVRRAERATVPRG